MSDDTKPADWREEARDIAAQVVFYADHAQGVHCEIHNGDITANMVLMMARALVADSAPAPPQAGLDPLTQYQRMGLIWAANFIRNNVDSGGARNALATLDRLLRLSDAGVPEPKPCAHGHDCPQCTGGAECACEPPVREPTDDSKRIANWLDAMAEEYRKTGNESRAAGLWWAASGIRLGAWRDHPETTKGRASTDRKGEADE